MSSAHPPNRCALSAGRIVTCSEPLCSPSNPLGVVNDGVVIVNNGRIEGVCSRMELRDIDTMIPIVIDAPDCVITPGFVDSHTHIAWSGSRHDEYLLRMEGAGYESIASAGGGIVASMRSVREDSVDSIVATLRRRLRRIASLGVTTCEIKSGYGLSLDGERKQLEAINAVKTDDSLPAVVPTFLALHAVPPEGIECRSRWVRDVVCQSLPAIARDGLAEFVDAYIDRNAFTVEEAKLLFESAFSLGMGIRAHVGQFADIGGASLAASFGAASVDHVEHISESALRELADAGTCVILLPTACFTLKQLPPPVDAMRRSGVRIAVASDANPGTAPTESLPLALAFAVHTYHLTATECILGATTHAAASLRRSSDIGSIDAGKCADLVVWDLPHEHAILQPWGSPITRLVMRGGKVLHRAG